MAFTKWMAFTERNNIYQTKRLPLKGTASAKRYVFHYTEWPPQKGKAVFT